MTQPVGFKVELPEILIQKVLSAKGRNSGEFVPTVKAGWGGR